ncbi:hypothetical protein GP486_008133, partial [Trichoglossum hirsutum]
MSVVAITLSVSIVVFVLLSLAIILCLRSRQRYLIDAYNRTNNEARLAQYPGTHAQITDQGRSDAIQGIALGEKTESLSSSYTLARPPRTPRKGEPPQWRGSLEWRRDLLSGHAVDGESAAAGMVPETTAEAFGLSPSRILSRGRPLKRAATFPAAQLTRRDPFLVPIIESPLPRSVSLTFPGSKTVGTTERGGTPSPAPTAQDPRHSSDTDKVISITEQPSRALDLEPLPDSPEEPKGSSSHTRGRPRTLEDCRSLASIIDLTMQVPATRSNGNNDDDDQRLQNKLSTLKGRSRSPPGMAPDSPVPPLPVKTRDHNSHRYRDILNTRGRSFLSWKSVPLPHCTGSFSSSSLHTTSSSILETAKYTASGQPDMIASSPHSYLPPSSPPNFASSPLSSHTSSGPSIFDSLATDRGTPPAAGLTLPSAVRLHKKQLSYGGANQDRVGRRGSGGLRQSVSCGARMLLGEGSRMSMVTLGRRGTAEDEKEGVGFQYHSSSSPGGGEEMLLNSPSGNNSNNDRRE